MTNKQKIEFERFVSTEEAAGALNRRPQTLRKWACLENGPIRPVRINGRLAWRVSDIQALLSGEIQEGKSKRES